MVKQIIKLKNYYLISLRLKKILLVNFLIIIVNLSFSQEIVYDFPFSVQKKMSEHLQNELKDTTKLIFLILDSHNNNSLLSYHFVREDDNDSLKSFIKNRKIYANVLGKLYPLLYFYDFLYSRNLNYKIENSIFGIRVHVPPSNLFIKFRGKPNSEGEIIE